MTRTIVAATDLSERSLDVLPHAVRIARAAGLDAVVLHVVNATAIWTAFPARAEELVEEARASARLKVAAMLDARGYSLPIHLTASLPGQPIAEAVLDGAVERGAVLLAMASRGASLVRAVVLGSTSLRVLARSHLPVLATGDAAVLPPADGRPYRVLFGTDGSAAAEAVARASAALIGSGGRWEVFVQHVDTRNAPEGPPSEGTRARVEQFARWFPADAVVETVAAAGASAPAEIAAALCAAAEGRQADAIAISSHSFRPLPRIMAGSVGVELLRRSRLPIIFGR